MNAQQNIKAELTLADFDEKDSKMQAELEKKLADARLEDTLSPLYFVQNVNAMIIGF
ncbi:MAG: hypothetical protein ACI360_07920 [Atopobiaceae bacterium]